MPASARAEVMLRYRSEGGTDVVCPLEDADADLVAIGQPVRTPGSYARQRHYSGLFWSATTGAHIVYESLLELSWLWLADFDRSVTRIAAQPFELVGEDSGRKRTRFPDFLSLSSDGVEIVDVKAPALLKQPGGLLHGWVTVDLRRRVRPEGC